MKKSFSGMLVAALALVGVLGTSSKANAAIVIDFENLVFDGGQITSLGGGNYSGSNIVFDSIFLKDTTAGPGGTSLTLAGAQCGASTTGGIIAETCKLDFNTLLNTFTLTSPTGLWNIGPDLLPYNVDRGAFIPGTIGNLLTGSFTAFGNVPGPENSLFAGAGMDTKDADLLAFFGLPLTGFTFANTEIHANANGNVTEADLINIQNLGVTQVPEPATMLLLGTGLLAAFRARRKSA